MYDNDMLLILGLSQKRKKYINSPHDGLSQMHNLFI